MLSDVVKVIRVVTISQSKDNDTRQKPKDEDISKVNSLDKVKLKMEAWRKAQSCRKSSPQKVVEIKHQLDTWKPSLEYIHSLKIWESQLSVPIWSCKQRGTIKIPMPCPTKCRIW